ncbi:MAG: PIN domain-containing protein, partial [Thioalkalispiraceae bacterium]
MANNRLFVIDSNVLMHDPAALFRFQEHDLFIPMMVLEELDNNKKGRSEVARNARQVSRFIDELMSNHDQADIEHGLKLQLKVPSANHLQDSERPVGRLFLQTRTYPNALPEYLPGNLPDNNILGTSLALKDKYPDRFITLVSKDINLRIKAAVVGIHAEDYHNDQVLEDVDLLYTGHTQLDASFWDKHSKEMDAWMEEGRSFYRLHGPDVSKWSVSEFLYSDSGDGFEAIV